MKHDPDFEKLVVDILPRIKEVSAEEINQSLHTKSFVLVDVREKEEWDEGRIPHAIHMSKGIIERDIAKNIHDKNQSIVLYCGGGYRSALAADNLQKMGYKNVKSMKDGIRYWKERNFPFTK